MSMPSLLDIQNAVGAFLTHGSSMAAQFVIVDEVAPTERLAI
jgi:hypothetical protein